MNNILTLKSLGISRHDPHWGECLYALDHYEPTKPISKYYEEIAEYFNITTETAESYINITLKQINLKGLSDLFRKVRP